MAERARRVGALHTKFSTRKSASSKNEDKPTSEQVQSLESCVSKPSAPGAFRLYRKSELNRITASLLANGSILVAGEEGSGKSVVASAVIQKLLDDGFTVARVEPATTKQM